MTSSLQVKTQNVLYLRPSQSGVLLDDTLWESRDCTSSKYKFTLSPVVSINKYCKNGRYRLCTISAPAVTLAALHNRKKKEKILHTPGAITPPGSTLGPSPSFILAQNKAKPVVCCRRSKLLAPGPSRRPFSLPLQLCYCCKRRGKGKKHITPCSHMSLERQSLNVLVHTSDGPFGSFWVFLSPERSQGNSLEEQ